MTSQTHYYYDGICGFLWFKKQYRSIICNESSEFFYVVYYTISTMTSNNVRMLQQDSIAFYSSDVTFSVCVPSSCSVEDVVTHVDLVLAPLRASTLYSASLAAGIDPSLHPSLLDCSSAEPLTFRFKDYMATWGQLISSFSLSASSSSTDATHYISRGHCFSIALVCGYHYYLLKAFRRLTK